MHIGTVTTGSAGSSASASITDDGNNSFTLNMTIPRGDTGSRGSTGPQGPTGPSAISAAGLTTNGYIRFTNGFTIQWLSHDANTNGVFTLPIQFTSQVYGLFRCSKETSMYNAGEDGILRQKDAARRWSYTDISLSSIDLIYGTAVKTSAGYVIVIGK